jgi:hypothetical protein
MRGKKNTGKGQQHGRKPVSVIFMLAGLLAVLIIGVLAIKAVSGGGEPVAAGGDLKILKSEITETAKFYPYKTGKTKMEVLVVKASDGSIRTAFNTCQVCYDSGRGYYEQQGDLLICQNCGNQFQLDQVEKIKGGCNPVPILEDYKTDDGTNITISGEFLQQNRELFGNWKK